MYNKLLSDVNSRVSEHKNNEWFIIGIDGNCGSGKSTLAQRLSEEFKCEVIHMDDFFLPKNLRTPKRLAETAGNIHYERFEEEVIKGIKSGCIEHKKFDCKKMDYVEDVSIKPNKVLIVEGSYSFSHGFYKNYDYRIFLKCSSIVQIERLKKRVGMERLTMFIDKWIPMENKYFKDENVEKKAEFVLDNSDEL